MPWGSVSTRLAELEAADAGDMELAPGDELTTEEDGQGDQSSICMDGYMVPS